MKATLLPTNLELPQPPSPRSKGIHVSNVIRGIALETGVLDKKWKGLDEIGLVDVRAITDPTAILRISIGLAWESWYIPHILGQEGVLDHPGEMMVDGIFMTHDAESLDVIITHPLTENRLYIHEIKATYKSTRTVDDITKQWMWMAQVMAYCKGAGTRHAKVHVLFLCGDYKMPIKPQLKIWGLEFTQHEIDENWSLITQYRDERS